MQAPEHLIETKHDDHIHDCAWDYYARRLATASSDRTVKIWAVDGGAHALEATLTGHDGPVWEVAWAHPQYGAVLASCSYDGSVRVSREDRPGIWSLSHVWSAGGAAAAVSVNAIEWAPIGLGGLVLACASSDGYVTVLRHDEQTAEWSTLRFLACQLGCNSVSWAPTGVVCGCLEDGSPAMRLATGGCDNRVAVWRGRAPDAATGEIAFDPEPVANEGKLHKAWVRDVAFAPFYGAPQAVFASCSEDKSVYVWCRGDAESKWVPTKVNIFDAPAWRVNWSVTGNIMAVASGDDDVSLWKESLTNEWHQLAKPEPAGEPAQVGY